MIFVNRLSDKKHRRHGNNDAINALGAEESFVGSIEVGSSSRSSIRYTSMATWKYLLYSKSANGEAPSALVALLEESK
jgi:hypothetical protein